MMRCAWCFILGWFCAVLLGYTVLWFTVYTR